VFNERKFITHFSPRIFSLGEGVAGAAALRELKIPHGRKKSQVVLLAHIKTGQS